VVYFIIMSIVLIVIGVFAFFFTFSLVPDLSDEVYHDDLLPFDDTFSTFITDNKSICSKLLNYYYLILYLNQAHFT